MTNRKYNYACAFTQHNEEPAERSPITTQGSKSQQFQASAKPIQARPDNQAPQVRAARWRKPAGGLPQNAQPPERTLQGSTESSGCPAAEASRSPATTLGNRFCRLQPRAHGARAPDRCPGGSKKLQHRWRRLCCPQTTHHHSVHRHGCSQAGPNEPQSPARCTPHR